MAPEKIRYQRSETLLDKEWQVIILTGFKQVNEHLSQIEDLMEEETSEVEPQLKETPELCVLSAMPGNIKGIKCYPVNYLATTVRKCEVKNGITVMDLSSPSKKWKKIESQKQKKHIEKIWEMIEMYTLSGLLNVCPKQKEIERGDVFYNWSRFPDSVGIT